MSGLRCPSSIHELVNNLDKIKNKNYLTHGIHPYPAKFIPQIPSCLINAYSKKNDSVLDPFCGSGTSLLEAMLWGRKPIGVDINPIATLIAKVKIYILQANERKEIFSLMEPLDFAYKKITSDPSWLSREIEDSEIPQFHNRDHWFQKNVQAELTWLKKLIKRNSHNESIANFLNLCFSAIIVKISNQDGETRWKAVEKNISDGYTIHIFRNTLFKNIKKSEALKSILNIEPHKATIFTAQAFDVPNLIGEPCIDLIVTSPPYLNSYDYYLYHKLRMFWLGYNHKKVQAEEIGSRNKHCDNKESIDTFIDSMTKAMKAFKNILKNNGICAMVVGDSIFRGQLVNMSEIYIKIAANSGFRLQDIASYNQRKYSKAFTPNLKQGYKQTHILVFSP